MILLGADAAGNFPLIKRERRLSQQGSEPPQIFPLMFNSVWTGEDVPAFYPFHMKPTVQTHNIARC